MSIDASDDAETSLLLSRSSMSASIRSRSWVETILPDFPEAGRRIAEEHRCPYTSIFLKRLAFLMFREPLERVKELRLSRRSQAFGVGFGQHCLGAFKVDDFQDSKGQQGDLLSGLYGRVKLTADPNRRFPTSLD